MQDYLAIYNQGNDTINNFIIYQDIFISYFTNYMKLELNGEQNAKVLYVYFRRPFLIYVFLTLKLKRKML